MKVASFFDERTFTITYAVWSAQTRDAVVIDPVLDYDPVGSRVWTESLEPLLALMRREDLQLRYILETHAHADHMSAAQEIKKRYPNVKVGISQHISQVQKIFRTVFDMPSDFATDGSQFDLLFEDGERIEAGSLAIQTIPTPGHTPACASFHIGDAVFTGDALLMPKIGTGRCDFPAASSAQLYESITERLYTLPESTRVFVGHDYPAAGCEPAWESTIGEQKQTNSMLSAGTSVEEYMERRAKRDAMLRPTRLLYQSIQVNIEAGNLPAPRPNDHRYLRIPLNLDSSVRQGEVDAAEKLAVNA